MENKVIMTMGSKKQIYQLAAFLFGGFAVVLLFSALLLFYHTFISGQIRGGDVPSVLVMAAVFFWIGSDLFMNAIGNLSKNARAKNNKLIIKENEVSGTMEDMDFIVPISEIVSVTIQTCSLDVKADTKIPVNMAPHFIMKMQGMTQTYLCISTGLGQTYYIDCLESPENAKSTIESVVARARMTSK